MIEYLPLGTLLEQDTEKPITAEEMIVLMYQRLSALAYAHSIGITHRDLKPENFLIYSRTPFSVKLCDFGLAQDKSMLQTFCRSPKYLAPEILNNLYTNAVDV